MSTTQEILARIRAATESEAPIGAFATEIESNASVEGNLNSKHLYNQTPEKDNGLQKMAGNKYLEKLANAGAIAVKPNLLNKVGLGISAAGFGVSAANYKNNKANIEQDAERRRLEEKSLRALNSINRNLSGAVLVKASAAAPIHQLASKALNNIGKSLSTNVIAPSKMKVFRPKGLTSV